MITKIRKQTLEAMKKTTVDLGARSYEILIGENIIDETASYISPLLNRPRTVIITDENVAKHQLLRLEEKLNKNNIQFESHYSFLK